jgi:hypothetical protein
MAEQDLQSAYLWTVVALVCVWLVVGVLRRYERGFDIFAPEVAFGGAYLFTSFAAPLYYLWSPGAPEGLLFAGNLSDYLALAATGFLGLIAGSLACGEYAVAVAARPRADDVLSKSNGLGSYLVASSLVGLGSLLLVVGLIPSWGVTYGELQFEYDASYYSAVAAEILLLPSLAKAVQAAVDSRRCLFLILAICPGMIALLGTTGRGQIILLAIAILGVTNYYRRRIRLVHVALLSVVVVPLISILGQVRQMGAVGLREVTAAVLSDSAFGEADGALALAASFGAPAFITTHVMRWFPEPMGWRYGMTYVNAVLSLIPSFIYGGPQDRPFESLGFLFKSLLEGPVPSAQGYAFAALAEAYVNFGYLGAFVVFFLLAFILRFVYLRATTTEGSGSMRLWYVLVLLSMVKYLRSDSISFVKVVFYNLVVLALIGGLASMLVRAADRCESGLRA